jgi:hypothetical protein
MRCSLSPSSVHSLLSPLPPVTLSCPSLSQPFEKELQKRKIAVQNTAPVDYGSPYKRALAMVYVCVCVCVYV